MCFFPFLPHLFDGIISANMKYSMTPGNMVENTVKQAHATLTTVGSMSKYSAMPAHTPNSFLSFERLSFLFIVVFVV